MLFRSADGVAGADSEYGTDDSSTVAGADRESGANIIGSVVIADSFNSKTNGYTLLHSLQLLSALQRDPYQRRHQRG